MLYRALLVYQFEAAMRDVRQLRDEGNASGELYMLQRAEKKARKLGYGEEPVVSQLQERMAPLYEKVYSGL